MKMLWRTCRGAGFVSLDVVSETEDVILNSFHSLVERACSFAVIKYAVQAE